MGAKSPSGGLQVFVHPPWYGTPEPLAVSVWPTELLLQHRVSTHLLQKPALALRLAHARLELLHGIPHDAEAEERSEVLRVEVAGRGAHPATLSVDVRHVGIFPSDVEVRAQQLQDGRGSGLHVVYVREAMGAGDDAVNSVGQLLVRRLALAPD